MYKKFIILILFLLINQCGYSPVYKENLDKKINLDIVNQTGDKNFNNKLYSELKQYQSNNSNNIFKLNIKSNVNKKIISKNTKGKATDYEISATVTVEVNYKDNLKNISFNEKLKIKKIDDTFEQQKYEKIVLNNFAKSIKEQLISRLNSMQ